MENNLTVTQTQMAPVGENSYPKKLAEAMQSPKVSITGSSGFEERPGLWKPPAVITPELQTDAKRELISARNAIQPSDDQTVRWWLMALGPLVASNISPEDARFKVNAFCTVLLKYPTRAAISRDSLYRAARMFKFWPTFSEVSEFWEIEDLKAAQSVYRLEAIARGNNSDFNQEIPTTLEERQAVGHKLGTLVAALMDADKMRELSRSIGLDHQECTQDQQK